MFEMILLRKGLLSNARLIVRAIGARTLTSLAVTLHPFRDVTLIPLRMYQHAILP